jgi:hypothetical protein
VCHIGHIKTIATDLVLSAIPKEKLKGKRSSLEKQIRAIADACLVDFDQHGRLENGQQSFETLIERLEIEARRILNESTAAHS